MTLATLLHPFLIGLAMAGALVGYGLGRARRDVWQALALLVGFACLYTLLGADAGAAALTIAGLMMFLPIWVVPFGLGFILGFRRRRKI